MILNEQQRQTGKDNFLDALKLTRRELIPALVTLPSVTAFYWGYERMKGRPVRAALIGAGGQGRSHIDSINPESIKLVAFSDIRPSQQKKARISLESKYGTDARDIELVEDYRRLLDRSDIEMVIIALPLHLHAQATIEALEKGKHVLCEKLMAKTVADCKRMARTAHKTGNLLAIGHQRHYSYLYANALEVAAQKDILGDVRHIRAFWHRNQTEGGKPGAENGDYDTWFAKVPPEDQHVDCAKYGYKSVEELVRWRLNRRTGEGLMAELGSHQLDACGILLKALLGGKQQHAVHPLAVSGIGVNSFFQDGREVEDHIYPDLRIPRRYRGDLFEHHHERGGFLWRAGHGNSRNAGHPVGARCVSSQGEGAPRHAYLVGGAAHLGTFGNIHLHHPVDRGRRFAGYAHQPRLSRRAGTSGVADPQSGEGSAAMRSGRGPCGRGGNPGLEHGGQNTQADRVQAFLV